MVLYGFLEISKICIDVAKITVSFSFSCPISHFFRNFEVSFMVLYGFLEISTTVIGVAKITVRFSFSCPVAHLSEKFEAYFKLVYGVLEIFKVNICVANSTIPFFFPCPLPNFIGNLVGIFTGGLCLSFRSHSTNKLQIKSTSCFCRR